MTYEASLLHSYLCNADYRTRRDQLLEKMLIVGILASDESCRNQSETSGIGTRRYILGGYRFNFGVYRVYDSFNRRNIYEKLHVVVFINSISVSRSGWSPVQNSRTTVLQNKSKNCHSALVEDCLGNGCKRRRRPMV